MRRHSLATSAFALILFICTSQAMAQLPKTEGSPLPNTSSFFIPDYKDGFATRGDASALSERCYLITQDQNNRFGRLWWNTKLDLTQPFRLDFIIFAGDKDGSGADGFGFVLQTDPRGFEATGRAGGGLGFGDYQFANKIIPSVAIEFDTWRNTECPGTAGDDPAHDHTAIAYNGNICDPQTNELSTNKTPRIHPTFDNIEDNSCYDYVILWQPNADGTQTIQMYVEEQLRISHTANMITTVFGGITNVNYGFTGSTGGARNEQTVCLSGGQQPPLTAEDNFTTPQNTSKLLPVRANDIVLNPDLDSLWTFTILTPAANGSSYIDGATLDIMYTPNVGFAGLDSIQYQICDVPVGRCYSLCSPEWAYIDVQCVPYNFMLDKLTDNELCDDALPDNGSARAYISSATVTSTSVNIWEEKFNDLSTNATVDNGTTSWNKSGNANGYAKVVNSSGNKRFEVNDADQIITWTSGAITTTGYSNVKIQASISEVGTLEGNDNVKAFYQVGTDTRVEFFNHSDDISGGSTSASVTIPDGSLGSTVKVIFEFINNSGSEYYSIDDVLVTGDSPPTTTYITAGYTFRWYNGAPGTTNAADLVYTGATYNTMAEGTYTVQATSTYGCDATPLTVTIDKVTDAPVVVINQVQEVTNCASPNGVLEAYVNVNGVPTTAGYTFLWYVGVDFTSSFATGPTATNLKAQNYSVRVINNTSGCEAVEGETVTSTLTAPTVQATVTANVTSCTAPNSGAVSASSGGVTAGFTFKWYKGSSIKAIADYTGATVSNLASGFYTVQAVNSSGCVSEGVTVEITNTSGGPVLETEFTENTSCRVDGNGTITTTSGGATTGFTFEYFIGQNTTNSVPAYKITGNDGNIASLLKGGIYTVKVTETATGCFSTEEVTISDIPSTLTIDPSQIDLNSNKGCGPTADGSIDASAAVSGGSGSSFDSNGNPIAISSSSNGGFDQPDIFGSTPFAQSFAGGTIKTYNQSNVPGWQTTSPDGRIEIWSSGAQGVPAYQGTQFAEINANNDATLYFDVVTVPGVTMNWSFAHRGRAGTDCIALLINAPGAPDNQINQFCTGNTAWSLYSGTYVVPAGQYVTRFFYKAVSTAGGNKSVGNFLDAITFEAAANTFELFLGNDTNGVPISSNETGVFSGLDEGTYSIKFLDNLTGCFVSATDLVVSLDQDVPNTVVTKVDNTGCTVGDGEILLVSESQFTPDGEPAAGYNMELWQGGVKIDEEIGVMWQNATLKARHTFTGLLSGTYTVKSTNPAKTCTFEQDVTLDDLSVDPQFVVTGTTNEPNHGCDTPDGRLTVQVDDGAGNFDDPAEYTFEWYLGSVVSAPNLLVNGVDPGNGSTPAINSNTVTGLAAGFYTVVATKTSAGSTGCESPQYTLEVSDEKTIPDITIVEDQPDISCGGAGTAQLSASVTENGTPGVTVGYTFEWFTGATAGTAGTGFATGTQTAANLSAGEYTVLVTNTATGCVNDLTYEINSNPVKPVTTLNTKNDNTSCLVANYNGGATVNVSFNGTPVASPSAAGYTFVWRVGSGTGGAVISNGNNGAIGGSVTGATTETIGGLNGGQYTVVATNPTTGCEADPFVVTIVNSPVLPNIVITKNSDQTNCDVPNNGSLSADVTVSGTPQLGVGYAFQWYAGGSVSGAVLTTNRQIDNLAAGTYTVRVTNQSTGCVQVATSSVAQVLADIDGAGTKADSEDCSGNGSITITSASITTSGAPVVANTEAAILASYNLTLQDASNADITDSDTDGSATFGGLMPGTYYVVITHKSSSCDSETLQFDIADNAVSPTLSIAEDQPSTICPGGTGGDGEATVTVTNAGGSTDYTYKWHTGTDTSTPIDPVLNTSAATATLTGVAAGFYTVLVTDNASLGDGCFDTETVEITLNQPTISISAFVNTGASNCVGLDNGSYQVTAVNYGGTVITNADAAFANFEFQFFNNVGTSIQAASNNPTKNTLAPGNYSVTVTNTVTKCASGSLPFTIANVAVAPTATVAITNNVSCDPATPMGAATATLTNDDTGTYTYQWFFGAVGNTTTPLVNGGTTNGSVIVINAGTPQTVSGLAAGNYWVRITDTQVPSNTCSVDKAAVIGSSPANLVVTLPNVTIVSDRDCATGKNGSIRVDQISDNGSNISGAVNLFSYSYQLLQSDGVTPIASAFNKGTSGAEIVPIAINLDGGTYFVVVSNSLNCKSAALQVVVPTNTTPPNFTVTPQDATICAGGASPDGEATVALAPDDGGTYTYQWYNGSAATGTAIANGDNGGTVTGATSNSIAGLYAGTYTVKVTDTQSNGDGCFTATTFVVGSSFPTITVQTAVNTGASNCVGLDNGSYQVTAVNYGGTVITNADAAFANFEFQFFNNAGTSIQAASNNPTKNTLAPGNYSVTVTNTVTKCASGSLPFTIANVAVAPTATVAITNNVSCDPATPMGAATANLTNSDGGTYTYQWFFGAVGNTTTPLVNGGTTNGSVIVINAGTPQTVSGLAAGNYWVRITDTQVPSNTCSVDKAAVIIDDQDDITLVGVNVVASSQCSPVSGSIEIDELSIVDAGGTTVLNTFAQLDDYTFTLYNASLVEIVGGITQGTTSAFPIASPLAAGTYFVSAANTFTCESATLQVDVPDGTTDPTITFTKVDNTSCTATGNGSITVTLTGGVEITGNYTYQWYQGALNNTGTPVGGPVAATTTSTINTLLGGTYWVEITDNAATNLGCVYKEEFTLPNTLETLSIPLVQITPITANTHCVTPNGSATVDNILINGAVTDPTTLSDYTFNWYQSDGTTLITQTDVTVPVYAQFVGGNYKVQVVNDNTGCSSALTSFTIGQTLDRPNIAGANVTLVNSLSCDQTNFPNGSITVTPDGTGTPMVGYTYVWYNAPLTGIGAATPLASTSNALTSVGPGVYSVVVTKTSSGCTSQREITVTGSPSGNPDISTVISGITATDVTTCNPINGSLTANLAVGAITDYNWFWYYDDKTTPVATGDNSGSVTVNNNAVTGLPDGDYFLRMQDKATGCLTGFANQTVAVDPAAQITINIFATQPGDCDGPTGILRIEATNASAPNFTFEVYKGESDLSASPILIASSTTEIETGTVSDNDNASYVNGNTVDDGNPTDYVVSGLVNDTYTVVATNLTSNCTERRVYVLFYSQVQRVDVDPLITTQALNCQPYTDGSGAGGTGGNTGEVDVTLRVPFGNGNTHDDFRLFLYPTTSVSPQPDMETGDGDPGTWETGDLSNPRPAIVQSVAGTVAGQTYQIDYTLGGGAFAPGMVIEGQTSSATATIATVNATTMTFTALPAGIFADGETIQEQGVPANFGTNDSGNTTNVYTFSGLVEGQYAVVAAEIGVSFCYSPPVTFDITDDTETIDLDPSDVADLAIEDNSDCSGNPNGKLTVLQLHRGATTDDVSAAGPQNGDYTYQWFSGADPDTDPALNAANVTAAGNEAFDLASGTYSLRVTKQAGTNELGCSADFVFFVNDSPTTVEITDHTQVDILNCDPLNNGSITINEFSLNGAASQLWNTALADWRLRLYDDSGNILETKANNVDNVFSGLVADDYIVVVFDAVLQCEYDPFAVTIDNAATDPDLSAFVVNPNTGCNGTTDGRTGSVDVTLANASTQYDIQWFVGGIGSSTLFVPGTDGTLVTDAAGTRITGASGGDYKLVAKKNTAPDDQCESIAVFNVPQQVDQIISFTVNLTHDADCATGSNGVIEVAGITVQDGITAATSVEATPANIDANYDFILLQSDGVTSIGTFGTASSAGPISNRDNGTYYLIVEDVVTKCQSAPKQITILNQKVTPTLSVTGSTANIVCNPAIGPSTPTGSITVTIGNYDASAYNIQWYKAPLGTTAPASVERNNGVAYPDGSDVTVSAINGAGEVTISGIVSGNYWVSIQDNATPGLGCNASIAFTVVDNFATIEVLNTNVVVEPDVDCDNNDTGLIRVEAVTVNAADDAAVDANYIIEFFDDAFGSLGNGSVNGAFRELGSLAEGTYYVTATNKTTGCVSGYTEVTVLFTPTEPILVVDTNAANKYCDTSGGGNGALSIQVQNPAAAAGVYYDPANYTFDWYDLQVGSAGLPDASGVGAGPGFGLDERNGLLPGFYTIVVTANDDVANNGLGRGCADQIVVEVLDDPYVVSLTSAIVTSSDADDCSPDNGQIEITDVLLDGTTSPLANYTFHLYQSDASTEILGAFAGTTAANLSPGVYFVEAQNNTVPATGCNSNLLQ
ncbi:MAG: hypothetical protein RIB71_19160, partial [Imperialibacter sp.]|uniref:lectin-like domain-containing protein n=1 Tax=Imperialibacter sp. TaxID=2038411 RepID=UPI0032EFCC8C